MSTGDNFKKRQEEAKKKQSGELPPDLDQDGKMINPHNPDFITKVPWYLGDSGPTLKHHNVQKVDHFLSLSEADQLIQSKLNAKKDLQKQKSLTYRKGACKNCGSMTHKEKDCVERPRSSKKAAWKSGLDIAADDATLRLEEHGKVSYDAKRDQWMGYNPTEFKSTVEKYERMENERRKFKQEEKERLQREQEEAKKAKEERRSNRAAAKAAAIAGSSAGVSGTNRTDGGVDSKGEEDGDGEEDSEKGSVESDSGSDYDSDEDDDSEDDTREFLQRDDKARDFQGRAARQGGVGGAQMKTTVRNLRLREDTPKYLRNLDLNSAHYDPKARSMRMNPLPDENPEDLVFAGDNFVRYSGDAVKLAQSQVLCWEMQARGEDIDILSNPSQAELVHKQFKDKKKTLEENKKKELFDKYGVTPGTDTSGMPVLDPRLRLGQTEAYVQYTPDGRVLQGGVGGAKAIVCTKYEEDVFINNHTSVWGSYFHRRKMCWGYHCCHSLVKNSYCTGEKGREINDSESSAQSTARQADRMLSSISAATSNGESSDKGGKEDSGRTSSSTSSRKGDGLTKRSDVFGESDAAVAAQLDEAKVQAAMKRLIEKQREDGAAALEEVGAAVRSSKKDGGSGAGKRSYNSMTTVDVTAEDMEAYRRIKTKRDDPMAAFLGGDDEILLDYNP